MSREPLHAIATSFATLPDPRIERTKAHSLLDIVTIALCAVVGGADSFTEIAAFGRSKEAWLRSFLALSNGIPSHDTFGRVFSLLDPVRFEQCLLRWVSLSVQTPRRRCSASPHDGRQN